MINFTLNDHTKPAMLRAIRAACNELLGETTRIDLTAQAAEHNSRAVELHAAAEAESDKAAAALTAHNYARGGEVSGAQMYRVGEQPSEQTVRATPISIIEAVEDNHQDRVPAVHEDEDLDSAGQPWNAELHSSSRAKIADGTWKKRRNVGKVESDPDLPDNPLIDAARGRDPVPPVPPVPAAPSAEPVMPKIFALITSQIVTINQAVEAAQAEGFADLGANGLGGAPREAQEAVLRKLEG